VDEIRGCSSAAGGVHVLHGLAEILAEVEPFKTTFLVGLFNRTWPYTLFAAGLLGLSIFIERPFCKYLCPLGAALAMPSTFRWYGLKRKQECDSCKACAVGCGSLAIDKDGRIDHRECLLCLDCMVFYTDEHACPPLVKERKRRLKAGLPLTPIGKPTAITFPSIPVPACGPPAGNRTDHRRLTMVDPACPPIPIEPPYAGYSLPLMVLAEIWDHLWPWSHHGFSASAPCRRPGGRPAASIIWMLAALGRLSMPAHSSAGGSAGACSRSSSGCGSKPYVKEGPWWGRCYRKASPMDMVCYVGFKNLLIGAALFIGLKSRVCWYCERRSSDAWPSISAPCHRRLHLC
jgi:NosR/NirI family transcriptional regulator, nitrous oxide reductase regulator